MGYSSEETRALFAKDERYAIGIRLYAVVTVRQTASKKSNQPDTVCWTKTLYWLAGIGNDRG